MEYRILPHGGEKISVISLGGGSLSWTVDEMVAILNTAIESKAVSIILIRRLPFSLLFCLCKGICRSTDFGYSQGLVPLAHIESGIEYFVEQSGKFEITIEIIN